MADERESIFDRAESLFRRTFEKLGAKVDSKITAETEEVFAPREIGDIISKLERAVDANLKNDGMGVRRLAPNYFKVLVTYERALNLNRLHVEALCKELKATVYEYIHNRRYETQGQIHLVIVRDFFEKATVVRAGFDAADLAVPQNELLAPAVMETPENSTEKPKDIHAVSLEDEYGSVYQFELKAGAAPVCLGRASGNRIRIEDQSLSRIHCSFTAHSDERIFVADLNSSNGTAVNGKPLRPNEAREIKAGDEIVAGDLKLVIKEIA